MGANRRNTSRRTVNQTGTKSAPARPADSQSSGPYWLINSRNVVIKIWNGLAPAQRPRRVSPAVPCAMQIAAFSPNYI